MNIILLVFGTNNQYHIQTYLCLLSLLKHINKTDTISVYTDHPEFYKRMKGHIDIIALSAQTLKDWIKHSDYIFRAKIKAIEDSAKHHPQKHLLFVDCDTVLYQSLDEMKSILNSGQGIMCNDEGHPSKMKGASLKMWKALAGKTIGNCTVSLRHNVWNSGIIGIPKDKKESVINLALKACDFILAQNTNCFTAEQYAFSIAMQENLKLHSAHNWFIHYWGNKEEWTALSSDFMISSFLEGKTIDEEIRDLKQLDFTSIPIRRKKHINNKRLIQLADKMIPDTIYMQGEF